MTEMKETKIKRLTASVYESPLAAEAFGEVFRPGGLKLTARAAEAAGIDRTSVVLDLACGLGSTVCFLAGRYGCRVIGIDLSRKLIGQAQSNVHRHGLPGRVNLVVGDGERLPFGDSALDAVISECSFSLMPDKEAAAKEINRVLRPGGRLSLTDVYLKGQLSRGMGGQAGFIACLAGARPFEDYVEIFLAAGLRHSLFEDHTKELKKTAYQVLINSGSPEKALFWLGQDNPTQDWMSLFREGRPGYALLTFIKPLQGEF